MHISYRSLNKILIVFLSIALFCTAGDYLRTELPAFNLPKNKQGISDRNYNLLSEARYDIFEKELNIGIQKYNFYWRNAEDKVHASNKPLSCPSGYSLFPQTAKEKALLGIKKYHCYKNTFVQQWKQRIKTNARHHIQVALVLWTAPNMYIDEGCEGFYFPLQKRYLMGGCYPKPEHYGDYEDWVRFIAYRFGKYVDHYIVWNEADSSNWADASTVKYNKEEMKENLNFHRERSFAIYTTLMKKTINAVNAIDKQCLDVSGMCKNFIYASLTGDWYSRKIIVNENKHTGAVHIRWRNMNLLDYIWQKLGLRYNWSIAVHPYGGVYDKSRHALRFSTLKDLSDYQKSHIELQKIKTRSWLSYPQAVIFASEQNAGSKVKANNWKEKAKFICESYDVARHMPQLIAVTHNHFQDNVRRKNPKPTKHTMLPSAAKADLSNANHYDTFKAYLSTSLQTWGKRNDHYCCRLYGLGCEF